MRRIGVLFFLTVIVIASCKKKDSVDSSQPVSITTVTNYFPLDTFLLNHFQFKLGSYWIYSVYNSTDSLYLTNYYERNDTVEISRNDSLILSVYPRVHFVMTSSKSSGTSIIIDIKQGQIVANSCGFGVSYSYSSPICGCPDYHCTNGTYCHYYMGTVTLSNSKSYSNATFFTNWYQMTGHVGPIDIKNKSILVPDIGIIQYKSEAVGPINLELLRYNVVK